MALVRGYGVCWDDVADVDGRRERIERGAFRYTISTSLRIAHDRRPGAVLCWRMPVAEDRTGLFFAALLDDADPDHRRAIAALRAGMSSCSIGYRPLRTRQEGDVEVVEQARLLEISLLGAGAFPGARAWLVE